MKKSPVIYICIYTIWILSLSILIWHCVSNSINAFNNCNELWKNIVLIISLVVIDSSLAYFWLNSIKDFIYTLVFVMRKKSIMKKYDEIYKIDITQKENPKFVLLYCTCNDFNGEALKTCMNQDYDNFKVVILDDSSKEEYKTLIDEFSKENNVEVVRREIKKGFKAGNLNNYLNNNKDYDYFVILDSDEIIPSDFIKKSLKYFYYSDKIGVVQASHNATKGENCFQSVLGMSIDSTSKTVQIMKNFYGANAIIGHGVAISKECFENIKNGFPLVVAEDISFAIEVKEAGYEIVYAPDIDCKEDFPENYICLKKRQCKWTQGNVEYMRKYSHEIKNSKMRWFEKEDIKLSHYSLPLVPILSFLIVTFTMIIGFMGFNLIDYAKIIFIISMIFLLSPLFPSIFIFGKTKHFWKIPIYYITSMITYASLAPMMIKTSIATFLGKKATFIVTPKGMKSKTSVWTAFRYTFDSVIFGLVIGVLTYFSWNSLVPSIILTSGCVLAPFIALMSNIKIKRKAKALNENKKSIENLEHEIYCIDKLENET